MTSILGLSKWLFQAMIPFLDSQLQVTSARDCLNSKELDLELNIYTVSSRPSGPIIKIVDNLKLSGFPGYKMFRPAFVRIKCPTTLKMKVT